MREAPAEEKMHTSKYRIKKKYEFWYLSFSGWYGMHYFPIVHIGSYPEFNGAVRAIVNNSFVPAMKET